MSLAAGLVFASVTVGTAGSVIYPLIRLLGMGRGWQEQLIMWCLSLVAEATTTRISRPPIEAAIRAAELAGLRHDRMPSMGRRGPAPTPTALRLLRGNPGRRPINHDEPTPPSIEPDSDLAQCPKWLTGEAKALWLRVAPGAIVSGLLTVVDIPAFEALCQSYARWRQFEKLTGKNLELAISKGYRNGAVKERQLMMQFGARFGFDPSSRSNVKLPQKAPESRVDRFRRAKTSA